MHSICPLSPRVLKVLHCPKGKIRNLKEISYLNFGKTKKKITYCYYVQRGRVNKQDRENIPTLKWREKSIEKKDETQKETRSPAILCPTSEAWSVLICAPRGLGSLTCVTLLFAAHTTLSLLIRISITVLKHHDQKQPAPRLTLHFTIRHRKQSG